MTIAGYLLALSNPVGHVVLVLGTVLGATAVVSGIVAPAQVASDVEKWLMHSFVGKHRLSMIKDDETFTRGKTLADYHRDLDLQIAALDFVLFQCHPTCEIYEHEGQPRLKVDVAFRQLLCRSRVALKVFGMQGGRWRRVLHRDDWRPVGAPPEDKHTRQRAEGPARFLEGFPAWGFERMKISVQIDLLGDGSYMVPKKPLEAECKA